MQRAGQVVDEGRKGCVVRRGHGLVRLKVNDEARVPLEDRSVQRPSARVRSTAAGRWVNRSSSGGRGGQGRCTALAMQHPPRLPPLPGHEASRLPVRRAQAGRVPLRAAHTGPTLRREGDGHVGAQGEPHRCVPGEGVEPREEAAPAGLARHAVVLPEHWQGAKAWRKNKSEGEREEVASPPEQEMSRAINQVAWRVGWGVGRVDCGPVRRAPVCTVVGGVARAIVLVFAAAEAAAAAEEEEE